MVKVMKKELEDKFNVIWFNTSDIRQSCLCSLDALNQMCRTYSVSISYNGDFVFSKFPCLSNMDLIHLVSHAHEPFFRIFQNCIMCCFSDIRTIIFHEGLCIFENPYSGLLLDTLQNTLKDDTFKEQPLFYLSAVCVALIDMWKERIQAVLHEKSYNRMERQKNVFSVASEHGLSLSNAQQLQLELREFRQGMSFLLKDRVEDMVNIVRDTKSCSSLSLYLEEATCLYRQVASLFSLHTIFLEILYFLLVLSVLQQATPLEAT
ncbi:hypothetical protein Gasu_31450 isoform 2 [Galdieria sulphuraria]|uniref:Uncharacterized protein n=1 Tax=Galdieria sulphuraria TaxID=130081 RepID=M2W1G5_GALSU|nr:hypothetical protein Gasu_31450 isoform 2 [Galdieria sulphuraria]EME29506.1 hypothetical protein isoform 2 [Galdieria sulphuraria]|eukprot:XP_005706026.1 hypothetical protein isoform 2 [Galdieria sulphuraria]